VRHERGRQVNDAAAGGQEAEAILLLLAVELEPLPVAAKVQEYGAAQQVREADEGGNRAGRSTAARLHRRGPRTSVALGLRECDRGDDRVPLHHTNRGRHRTCIEQHRIVIEQQHQIVARLLHERVATRNAALRLIRADDADLL
jgi:hypothetical protein